MEIINCNAEVQYNNKNFKLSNLRGFIDYLYKNERKNYKNLEKSVQTGPGLS